MKGCSDCCQLSWAQLDNSLTLTIFLMFRSRRFGWCLTTSLGNSRSPGNSVDVWCCRRASWQVWPTLSCCLAWHLDAGPGRPEKLASSDFNCSLSALNLITFSLALSNQSQWIFIMFFSVDPQTKFSSAVPVTPGRPSRAVSSSYLKTSSDTNRPKGSLVKRYLSKRLSNVAVSSKLCLSSGTCQYPFNDTEALHNWATILRLLL